MTLCQETTEKQNIHLTPPLCVQHWHQRTLWKGDYGATNPKDRKGRADLIETYFFVFDFGSPMVRLAICIGFFRKHTHILPLLLSATCTGEPESIKAMF